MLEVFDGALSPAQRRFALAETLAHLERASCSQNVLAVTRTATPLPILARRRFVDDELPPSTRAPESGA